MTGEVEDRLRDLMALARQGDQTASRQLLSALAIMFRRYFARRVDVAADVEDLVQDCLIAIHTRGSTYDPAQPFSGWAYAVARHKLIDFWRRKRRRIQVPLDDVADWLASPEDLGAESRGDLERILALVSDRQGQLIRDVRIEGLSLAEAGRRLGLSEGAAKVGLHRALKALAARVRQP